MPVDYEARTYALQMAATILNGETFTVDQLLHVSYSLYNFLTVADLHEVD